MDEDRKQAQGEQHADDSVSDDATGHIDLTTGSLTGLAPTQKAGTTVEHGAGGTALRPFITVGP